MLTIFPGLKAEILHHRDWIMSSFGKYSIDEIRQHINFDVIVSPPGFTRRQAFFGFDGRNK